MTIARCSSCHCYSRNCPTGQPNHKTVPNVGPTCTMNGLGRHYRDPTDPQNPFCNYESGGVPCTFFRDSEFANLPYPDDVTLGPVSESQPDLSTILAVLTQQKEDAERHRLVQAQEMQLLRDQVNGLMRTTSQALSVSTPLSVVTTVSTVSTTPSMVAAASVPQTQAPIMSHSANSAPSTVANAAASLNAALQSGLGQERNHGFPGLTIGDLRANQFTTARADTVLREATMNVPALNPQLGPSLFQQNQVTSVDQLYRATTINKQLRAYEFAATGQFSYRSQLKVDNVNAVTFAYGALKHLEAIKCGLIGHVTDSEFLSRIRHLRNVFEIACLSSNLSSFTDPAWHIAREYDNRVIADIESGAKSWESLSNSIEPDSIYCAKETVENRNRQNKSKKAPNPVNPTRKEGEKPVRKVCTTFNSHKSTEGCYWEQQNEGKSCVYAHYCSWCKANRSVEEKHKLINCDFKPE